MAIISFSKKFIFIHNSKVAGTSMRAALMPYEPFFLRNKFSQYLKHKFVRAHISAAELKDKIPHRIFNTYFKFGLVRDPWDRQISLYEFIRQNPKHFQHDLILSFKDFNEYLYWRVNDNLNPQKTYFYDNDGNFLVDEVYKIENLPNAIKQLESRLNIQLCMPHYNKSKRQKFREYYTIDTWNFLADAFQEDIKAFNYDPKPPKELTE